MSAVQALLEKGARVNVTSADGDTPLHVACDGGHMSAVQAFLEKGADVEMENDDGHTPLHIACFNLNNT
jgi:ankyrin repeat protein